MKGSASGVLAVSMLVGLGTAVAPAWANDLTSGDWMVNVDDPESLIAGTVNDAGQMLGQFCSSEEGHCLYAVGFGLDCEKGDSYPALVNTDVSAASITLLCGDELDDGTHMMFVEDFDQIDTIIRKARKVGFALPMQGDEFKAVRFSLKGSVAAMDAMRKIAARGSDSPSDSSKARPAKDSEVF